MHEKNTMKCAQRRATLNYIHKHSNNLGNRTKNTHAKRLVWNGDVDLLLSQQLHQRKPSVR